MFNYFKKKYTDEEGVEWLWTHHWSIRPFMRVTVLVQYLLWKVGINWHNTVRNECTPNFNCCTFDNLAVIPPMTKKEYKKHINKVIKLIRKNKGK